MPGFDDLLTRELERAARPAESAGVFERVDRRRARRHVLRRVQVAALTVIVLAGTAGGVAVLDRAFRTDDRTGVGESPAAEPENGSLVLVRSEGSRSHLWIVEPAETGAAPFARQLTFGPTDDVNPAVSPDGRTVAFVRLSEDFTTSEIWVVGIDGSGLRRLTDPSLGALDPAWSPDGTTIAFASSVDGGRPQRISLIDVDGSDPRAVSPTSIEIASDPTWSPDATQIAFSGADGPTDTEPINLELFVMPADGSGRARNITRTPDAAEVFPAWSPDGELVAFVGTPSILDDTPRGGIAVIRPDGSGRRFLVDDGTIVGDPTWSPDGTLVAFTKEDADGQAIFAVEPDGTGLRRLAGGFEASWQPLILGGGTAAPQPTPTVVFGTPPQAWDPERISGASFPPCNVTKVDATFLGPDSSDAAFMFGRKGDVGGCSSPGEGFTFIGLGTRDGELSVVSGPIDCVSGCRVFAAPDLDGDGTHELAVVTATGASTVHISLYRLGGIDGPGSGPLSWEAIEVASPGNREAGFPSGPVMFPLYGSVTHVEQLRCIDEAGARRVVATVAERAFDDPARYHVRQAVFEYRSGALLFISSRTYPVAEGALAAEGLEMGPHLCGAPTGP
jgi:Tol biopolymer transport system component